jgi:hypothetical protein
MGGSGNLSKTCGQADLIPAGHDRLVRLTNDEGNPTRLLGLRRS